MFRPIKIIGTIGRVGTITDSADSAYFTYMDPSRFANHISIWTKGHDCILTFGLKMK